MLLYGLAALAVGGAWFIKNLITTGNPFYPFFLTGGAMDAVRLQVYQHLPAWGGWLDLLPMRATYLGLEGADGYSFAPGMLLLGLGGLAWLLVLRRPAEPPAAAEEAESWGAALFATAGLLALAGVVLWTLGNQYSGYIIQTRFYISIFPAFAVLAAAGDVGLRRTRLSTVRLGRIGAAIILMALSLNCLEVGLAGLRHGAPQTALGLKTADAYLADALGWYQPAMQAVSALPEGQRVPDL